jgi:phage/plasmid-associated DNA primase
VLIPSCGKQPKYKHKDNQYTWDKWTTNGFASVVNKDGVDGCMIRLTAGIIVIDVDDIDIAGHMEESGGGFDSTVACKTKKGMHYYFRRTPECDELEIYDSARSLQCASTEQDKYNGDVYPIDIKTCGKPGTSPGVISVPPSPGKEWVRSPWEHEILPIPESFIDFFKACHKTRQHSSGTLACTPGEHKDLNNYVTMEMLRKVLDMLSSKRADDYYNWRSVVFAINNTCYESGHSMLDRDILIHDFSRKCPSKYSPDRVDQYIKGLLPYASGNRFGTLGNMAKEDSPHEWKVLRNDMRVLQTGHQVAMPASKQVVVPANKNIPLCANEVKYAIETVQRALGLEHLQVSDVCIIPSGDGSANKGILHVELSQPDTEGSRNKVALHLDTLQLVQDDKHVGYLHDTDERAIPIVNYDLAAIDKSFRPGMQWVTTRPTEENIKFTSSSVPRAQIDIINYLNPKARSAKVHLPDMNKASTVVTSKKLDVLMDAYSGSIHHAVNNTLGLGNALLINNMQVVINNGTQQTPKRRTDTNLIQVLMASVPDIKRRWCFSPVDMNNNNCNGLYYCNPTTNFWQQVHNQFVEAQIVDAFQHVSDLSDNEKVFVQSRDGSADMRIMLARKVLDMGFNKRLDENVDVFAVKNGVFDVRIKSFRMAQPTDMVSIHATWNYDPELAKTKRPELEQFIAQVLPLEEERRVVLSFFALLLSGQRSVKKFLLFTDKRAGDNGKTTLVRLFRAFYSTYSKLGTKFVCKGSFDSDKNAHDGALEPFKGRRLLVAEELKKNMTLDVAMLKAYTGGGMGEMVEGRKCGSPVNFTFRWQAGIVLVFNQGDIPKFDVTDDAFIARMVVVPARSKFVTVNAQGKHPELGEEYTFPMDKTVESRFPEWLPALADILLEHYDINSLDSIPDSMRQWRTDLSNSNNEIAEWFQKSVELTGDKNDYILIKDLQTRYTDEKKVQDEADGIYEAPIKKARFHELVRGYFASHRDSGAFVKDTHSIRLALNQYHPVRNVVLGARYMSP